MIRSLEISILVILTFSLIIPSIYILAQHIGDSIAVDMNSTTVQKQSIKLFSQNKNILCMSTKYLDYMENWDQVTIHNDIMDKTNNFRQLTIISLLSGIILLSYTIFLIFKHNDINSDKFKNFIYLALISVSLLLSGIYNISIGNTVICNKYQYFIKFMVINSLTIGCLILLYAIIKIFLFNK
jgi:hypothetical protein